MLLPFLIEMSTLETQNTARQWCHWPLIPALWRQRQVVFWVPGQPDLQSKFQGQGYTEKPCLVNLPPKKFHRKQLIIFELNVSIFWDLIELHYCWLFFSNTWCWPSSQHVAFLMSTVLLISVVFSKIIFAIRFLKGHPNFSGLCIVLGVIFWSEHWHHISQTICEQRNGQCSKLSICWELRSVT